MHKAQKDHYHHGNLREALLRQGLKTLSEQGEAKLSLRETAKQCGVSAAAPYTHFKNKADFLRAIQDFVMQELTQVLKETAHAHAGEKSILTDLGLCYVEYFLENPKYASVLFSEGHHAEAVIWNEDAQSNPAFMVLKDAAEPILNDFPIPEQAKYNIFLAMWALVHGLCAIVTIPGIAERMKKDPAAKMRLRGILTAFSGPEPGTGPSGQPPQA